MTEMERQEIRRSLARLGYKRVDATQEPGDGRYEELWQNTRDSEAEIVIRWGTKTD